MRKVRKDQYFELAVFCMDYHSGQWSRGYRLLSKLHVVRLTDTVIAECRDSEVYHYLVATYGDKV